MFIKGNKPKDAIKTRLLLEPFIYDVLQSMFTPLISLSMLVYGVSIKVP